MQYDPLLNGITNKCHQILATNEKVVNKEVNSNVVKSLINDEQSTEPIHISIQSSFNFLKAAKKDDSFWILKIYYQSPSRYVSGMTCIHLILTPHTRILFHF